MASNDIDCDVSPVLVLYLGEDADKFQDDLPKPIPMQYFWIEISK